MAWPNDDRYYDFTNLGPMPHGAFNAIQDEIIALNAAPTDKKMVFWPSYSELDSLTSYSETWVPQVGLTYYWPHWVCIVADESLFIPLPLPPGSIFKGVDVKLYADAATGISAMLQQYSCSFGVSTDPTTVVSKASAALTGTPPCWDVVTLTPSSDITITDDDILLVRVYGADISDLCGGALVTYTPAS